MRRGYGHGGPPRNYEWISGRLSRMVEPALLYLLATRTAVHGYDLIQAANELGLSEMPLDPGGVYRCLRQLEAEGCTVSTWDIAGVGPPRRIYALTDSGWQRLRNWVEVIEQRSQAMQAFVEQCRHLLSGKTNTQ